MTAALRGCQSALSTKLPARVPLCAYGGGRRRSWHVGCCPSATGMEGDDVGSAAGDSAPGRRDARQSQTTLPSGSGCGRKPRICGRRLHARPPRRGRNVWRCVDRHPLDAVRSAVWRLRARRRRSVPNMRGRGGGAEPASARDVVDGESHACQVRRSIEHDSHFMSDRLHGEADGTREGRRVSRASEIGVRGSDHRAGSLVRRCKGCRSVVSSREVPRSG